MSVWYRLRFLLSSYSHFYFFSSLFDVCAVCTDITYDGWICWWISERLFFLNTIFYMKYILPFLTILFKCCFFFDLFFIAGSVLNSWRIADSISFALSHIFFVSHRRRRRCIYRRHNVYVFSMEFFIFVYRCFPLPHLFLSIYLSQICHKPTQKHQIRSERERDETYKTIYRNPWEYEANSKTKKNCLKKMFHLLCRRSHAQLFTLGDFRCSIWVLFVYYLSWTEHNKQTEMTTSHNRPCTASYTHV